MQDCVLCVRLVGVVLALSCGHACKTCFIVRVGDRPLWLRCASKIVARAHVCVRACAVFCNTSRLVAPHKKDVQLQGHTNTHTHAS